jgi:uncharacterized membrane protein
MHGDMGFAGWGVMIVPTLVWLGFVVVIAWGAWSTFRTRREPDSALDLLKDSYARGRITRDEYLQAKNDLV